MYSKIAARASARVAKSASWTNSFLNEASFPSTVVRRFSPPRLLRLRRRGQFRWWLPPAVMLDLERAAAAQAPDLGGIRPHDPSTAIPGELPRVQPTRPPPPMDDDRL